MEGIAQRDEGLRRQTVREALPKMLTKTYLTTFYQQNCIAQPDK
jgi:hypothetical protein